MATRNKAPFKVGDLVTTDWDLQHDYSIIRKIINIHKDATRGSGWRASVDAGEPCPHCNRYYADTIEGIDGSWFIKMEKDVENATKDAE